MVQLKQVSGTITKIVTHGLYTGMTSEKLPSYEVEDDGSVKCVSGQVINADYLYTSMIQPFYDCAKRYNVSLVETEIGTDTESLTQKEYLQYNKEWLSTLSDHRIGWMFNCVHNIFAPIDCMWLNSMTNPIQIGRAHV